MSRGRHADRRVFERLHSRARELPGAEAVQRAARREVDRGIDIITEKVGGPARVRVVVLLAAVLGLSSADTGAISSIAPQLERSLHIGNVDIGLLVTVAALTGAVGMLPIGWVTDRWNRTHLVTVAVWLWGAAEIVSAFSPSYRFLLIVRLSLGALTAVSGPAIASLTGDLFPARERSQVYGYILTGELIGAGFGLLVAGLFSAWFSWRVGLAVLSIPSFILAFQFHRRLPEPARGGQSRLERGAEEVVGAADVTPPTSPTSTEKDMAPPDGHEESDILKGVHQRRVDPNEGLVLDRDPMGLGWWEAFHYVVAVKSNLTLIVASALGYFFFGGVETFAFVYIEGHFGVGQGLATLVAIAIGLAAVVGAIAGGGTTDFLLRRGHLDSRLVVPAGCFLAVVIFFIPAVTVTTLIVAIPLFLIVGFFIAAPNPGLDSARLDVMPSRMWGRGEAVRSFLRSILQASAPLLFGLVSTAFGGTDRGLGVTGGGTHAHGVAHNSAGLEPTFLIMLVALVAAAVIVWRGRKPYPTDVAAAAETEKRFPPGG